MHAKDLEKHIKHICCMVGKCMEICIQDNAMWQNIWTDWQLLATPCDNAKVSGK